MCTYVYVMHVVYIWPYGYACLDVFLHVCTHMHVDVKKTYLFVHIHITICAS